MPGLSLYTGSRSAAIFRRSRELIEHDDIVVIAGFTSGYQVDHCGRAISMRPGEAIVLTGAESASFGGPAQKSVSLLRVPLRSLAPLVANLDAAYGRAIPADNRALELLIRYVGILEEAETFAEPDVRRQAVSHVHDLMALAIGAARDAAEAVKSRGARAARLRVIKEDIANSIASADLSLATLATRHRVMPRYIQRLFESEGTTFTDYVLAQRLALAHRLLSDSRRDGIKVSAIAFDAGFNDLSYFNRSFRRRLCIKRRQRDTPSELPHAAPRVCAPLKGEVDPRIKPAQHHCSSPRQVSRVDDQDSRSNLYRFNPPPNSS
jgi:AraC-like DNA-binding protein